LDTFSYYIPTMILQPFIENAIWHGISGLKGGGKVTLRFGFSLDGDQLLAEVEDNGRGREATKKQRRSKDKKKSSLEITKKRLLLINNALEAAQTMAPVRQAQGPPAAAPKKARIEFEDKYSEVGRPTGTKVLVYLPLIYPSKDESGRD